MYYWQIVYQEHSALDQTYNATQEKVQLHLVG